MRDKMDDADFNLDSTQMTLFNFLQTDIKAIKRPPDFIYQIANRIFDLVEDSHFTCANVELCFLYQWRRSHPILVKQRRGRLPVKHRRGRILFLWSQHAILVKQSRGRLPVKDRRGRLLLFLHPTRVKHIRGRLLQQKRRLLFLHPTRVNHIRGRLLQLAI